MWLFYVPLTFWSPFVILKYMGTHILYIYISKRSKNYFYNTPHLSIIIIYFFNFSPSSILFFNFFFYLVIIQVKPTVSTPTLEMLQVLHNSLANSGKYAVPQYGQRIKSAPWLIGVKLIPHKSNLLSAAKKKKKKKEK